MAVSTVIAVPPDGGFPVLPYVVIATLDSPPSLDSFTGIAFSRSSAHLGYNLTPFTAPITSIPGGLGYPSGYFVSPLLLGSAAATFFSTRRRRE